MRCYVVSVLFCLALIVFAQKPPAEVPDAQQLVTREFGKSFTIVPSFAPLFADVDGDGQEDAVIVVTSPTPLVDEVDFKYRAIDPYDAYWGWGNAHDTVQFSATNVGAPRFIAIVHNWHTPKAKFLVINLPFEKLGLSRVTVKKKPISSIHAVETTGLESDLFWDGKKYKWEPGYINQ